VALTFDVADLAPIATAISDSLKMLVPLLFF
jgi:hypothetical protein